MSALRDLVMGQGCSVDAGPSGANPLANLFSGIIESNRKPEQLGDLGTTHVPISSESRQKIANRAGVVTRHLYPDASKDFLEEQVQSLIHSLNGGEGPSWQADQEYQQLFPTPPAAQRSRPSTAAAGSSWAEEFREAQPMRAGHAGPSWAADFQEQRPLKRGQAAWADEYLPTLRNLSIQERSELPSSWAAEFGVTMGRPQQTEQLSSSGQPASAWADEYVQHQARNETFEQVYKNIQQAPELTPEKRKAMKGASADDPLNDDTAASWVRQYNEELARPSTNALEVDMKLLEFTCRLLPAKDNPYTTHALPLQIARQMEEEGRLGSAALAYEAAVRAAPANREAWWRLGRCRLDLEEHRKAAGPLVQALRGRPTHPGNEAVWRALVQAALGADLNEDVCEALQWWQESISGRPDAALALGKGRRMSARDLEGTLMERTAGKPGDTLAWEMLGYLHTLRGNHDGAAEAFGKAVITGMRQDNNGLCLLGGALSRLQKHAEAERVLRAATAAPDAARAWAALGRCQAAQGKFEEAVQSHAKALGLRPDSTSLWDSLALSLTALGRMDIADAAAKHDQTVLQRVLVNA